MVDWMDRAVDAQARELERLIDHARRPPACWPPAHRPTRRAERGEAGATPAADDDIRQQEGRP